MSKLRIKLGLSGLGSADKLQKCRTVHAKLTGNADFPNPVPTLPAFKALIDAAEAARTDMLAKYKAAEEATQRWTQALDAACAALSSIGSYVEDNCGDDPAKVLSTGLDVRADGTAVTQLGQVQNLAATSGDQDGQIDLTWDRVDAARSYEIESSPDANKPEGWTHRETSTTSKTALVNLPSGCKLWFRVRAIGPNKVKGAWSDPAVKIVP